MNPPLPSPWLLRHVHRLAPAGRILDLACGSGRHSRWLAARGYQVLAVDRDAAALAALAGIAGITTMQADLEAEQWPLAGVVVDGVVVTRYLHRPRLEEVLELLAPGGVLIYETFMVGHERHGRPTRPDFLLREGELLQVAERAGLFVVAFEQGLIAGPARVQRLCAMAGGETAAVRLEIEPEPARSGSGFSVTGV